jgi:hypothetical protein
MKVKKLIGAGLLTITASLCCITPILALIAEQVELLNIFFDRTFSLYLID